MNENPYDILGVSRDASLDEVKKAYRKKARENHPDLNPDDTEAADRMNKINEAYDRIINPEKYTKEDARKRSASSPTGGYGGYGAGYGGGYDPYGDSSSSGPNSSGGGQNPGGWGGTGWEDFFGGAGAWGQGRNTANAPIHPEAAITDSAEIRQAINLINAENFEAAIDILSNIPSSGRNARWYYLSALANNGAGNAVQALDQIRRARQMDPDNSDYINAENSFTQRASSYEQESTGRGFSTRLCDPTTICCCLCCAILICNSGITMGLGYCPARIG